MIERRQIERRNELRDYCLAYRRERERRTSALTVSLVEWKARYDQARARAQSIAQGAALGA